MGDAVEYLREGATLEELADGFVAKPRASIVREPVRTIDGVAVGATRLTHRNRHDRRSTVQEEEGADMEEAVSSRTRRVRARVRVLMLGAAAVSVALAMGCGSSSDGGTSAAAGDDGGSSGSGGKGAKLAVFYVNGSSFGVSTYQAAVEEAKKLGVSVTGFNGNNTPQTQSQQVQDAITTGKYKGFLIYPLNAQALKPQVAAAEKAGIKIVTGDATFGDLKSQIKLSPTPGLVTTVGQSIGEQQEAFAESIRRACAKQVGPGKPCNVAFMVGLANFPTDTLRIDYLKKTFATGPIKLKLTPPGQYDTPTSQKVALTYFGSKPDIQVFHSFGDQMSAGVITALKQLNIVPGKDIQVLGAGGSEEMVDAVKAGTAFGTIALYPKSESVLGVQALVDALDGKKVEPVINVVNGTDRPFIIDGDWLEQHPDFEPEWSVG
jgi:ribose transport system substrate-binding protein